MVLGDKANDGLRKRMCGRALDGSGECQQFFRRKHRVRDSFEVDDVRLTFCERSGLVEGERVESSDALDGFAALDQQARCVQPGR